MERRILGRTGLEVMQLGFGAMEIRGPRIWSGRPVTDGQAERILNAVLDAGINFIDTAYDYGLSEEYIGRFISHRRSEYYLATKRGCTVVNAGDHDETPHVWTRENLLHNSTFLPADVECSERLTHGVGAEAIDFGCATPLTSVAGQRRAAVR
jgi:aryl-alcohol dehydrogenase-like predicted oxidoreductase